MTEDNLVQQTYVFRRIRKSKSGDNIFVSLLPLFWTIKGNDKYYLHM